MWQVAFGVVLGFVLSEGASWLRRKRTGEAALLQCVVELGFMHHALASHVNAVRQAGAPMLDFKLPRTRGMDGLAPALELLGRAAAAEIMWLYLRAGTLERLSHGISAVQGDYEGPATPELNREIDQFVQSFAAWQLRLGKLNASKEVRRVLPMEKAEALERGESIEL